MRALDASLYTLLKNDPTIIAAGVLGVYKSVAPEGAMMPYLIFDQAAAPNVWTLCNIAYTDYYYNIRATVEGYAGEEAAQAIAETVAAVVNNTTALSAGVGKTVSLCRATQEMSYPEREENQVFFHAGAQYHIEVMNS